MRLRRLLAGLLLGCLAVSLLATPVQAQPGGFGGRGGRGGFGRGGFGGFGVRSLLDVTLSDTYKAELKITDEQKTKLEEIRNSAFQSMGRGGFRGFGGQQQSEEERLAQEKERETQRLETETKIKAVITPEQFARASQIFLHVAGPSNLTRPDLVAELKITDDQKKAIQKAQDDARTKMFDQAAREAGGPDFFANVGKERDAAILAALTADQKKAWETKIGPPPADSQNTAGTTPMPGGTTAPMTVTNPTPAPRMDILEPTKSTGDKVIIDTSVKGDDDSPKEVDPKNKKLSFNFAFAPWSEVLNHIRKEAGLSLEMSRVPPGTFNYVDRGEYSLTEALDIINGHLLQKGFLLIQRDKFLVVWCVDDPVPTNLIPEVTVEELPQHGRFELLTMLINLEGMDTATAIEEVKELLGPMGKAVPLSKTNRIAVTDIGSNLKRIHRLLTGADVVKEAGAADFRAFQLKHITAIDAERMVRDLFGLPARGRSTTVTTPTAAMPAPTTNGGRPQWGQGFSGYGGGWGGRGDWGRGDRNRDQNNQQQQLQTAPGTTTTTALAANSKADEIQVAADNRTNSLLVKANKSNLTLVEQLVKTIDVDQDGTGNRIARAMNTPQLEVYSLQNVDLAVIVEQINAIVPGLTITQDPKGRRLSVYATPDEQSKVRGIITQFDGGGSGINESVSVLTLKNHDPVAVTATLRSMFTDKSTTPPSIEANAQGKQILVRANPEQMAQIRSILKGLGEDGEPRSISDLSANGNIRTFPLNGRNADEFVNTLKTLLEPTVQNPIRIVVPSAPSPKSIERRSSNGSLDRDSGSVPVELPKASPKDSRPAPADAVRTGGGSGGQEPTAEDRLPVQPETDSNPAEGEPAKPASDVTPVSSSQPTTPQPLNITVLGDRVVISSGDIQVLNQAEQLIQTMAQMQAGRPRWTVFYLRSMDASEAATLLGQLIPASSVSKSTDSSTFMGSLSGGLASLGSGLMDASGLGSLGGDQTLRIIPETRSNSLFVTGSDSQIQQIEDFLKLLDAEDLPETLKDRVPRPIVLEYADVKEVQTLVEEIFKEQLQGSNPQQGGGRGGRGGDQQQQQFNPLAMILGGGQGNRRGIQMTIGIDERTNTLLVSANDALFRQVETMVKERDQAAKEAQRTVQAINLTSTNSVVVQQALQSLLGKVNVSSTASTQQPSTGSRTGQTSPFGQGGGFGQGQSGGMTDDARRQFLQRLQQGQGGQGGFGSRGQGQGGFGNRGGGGFGNRGGGGFGNRGGGGRGGN